MRLKRGKNLLVSLLVVKMFLINKTNAFAQDINLDEIRTYITKQMKKTDISGLIEIVMEGNETLMLQG